MEHLSFYDEIKGFYLGIFGVCKFSKLYFTVSPFLIKSKVWVLRGRRWQEERTTADKQGNKKATLMKASSVNSMKHVSSRSQMMLTKITAISDALANVCVIFTLKM